MKKVLKWFGIVLGGLVGLVLVAALVLVVIGTLKVSRNYSTEVETVSIPSGPEAVERGKHLVEAVTLCVDCHGDNLGGTVLSNDPMMAILAAPNLTKGQGGVGGAYSDEDFVRALRHGVRPDGKAFLIMPANLYAHFNDADLGAVIAFIRSKQPVDSQLPNRQFGLLGRLLMGAGMFPDNMAEQIKQSGAKPSQATPGVTKEYGEYLSQIGGCRDCHGPNLAGNLPGSFAPYGPNLTQGGELARWSEADFVNAIRTGQHPGGRTLSDDMPWKKYSKMTDEELKALWAYLSTTEALATNPTGK